MLWLIKATRGYDLTNEPLILEALQNTFILIYRWIYPCYSHIRFYLLVFLHCHHFTFAYFNCVCSIWTCCNSIKYLQSLIIITT